MLPDCVCCPGRHHAQPNLIPVACCSAVVRSATARSEDPACRERTCPRRARQRPADRLRNYQVPGASVGVVANGELEWERGYGITAEPGTKPVTAETLFQAASI